MHPVIPSFCTDVRKKIEVNLIKELVTEKWHPTRHLTFGEVDSCSVLVLRCSRELGNLGHIKNIEIYFTELALHFRCVFLP